MSEQVAQIWLPRNSGGDMHQSVERSPRAIIGARADGLVRTHLAVDGLHAQAHEFDGRDSDDRAGGVRRVEQADGLVLRYVGGLR